MVQGGLRRGFRADRGVEDVGDMKEKQVWFQLEYRGSAVILQLSTPRERRDNEGSHVSSPTPAKPVLLTLSLMTCRGGKGMSPSLTFLWE